MHSKRIAMSAGCLLATALLTLAACETQGAIAKSHPRIYVTPKTLAAIRARCKGPMKDTFASMRKASWIMKRPAKVDWSDCTNMGYPAFMYLVTGERKYLAKTKEFLDALIRRPPRNQYLSPEFLRAACVAADWIWNDLTPAERKRYGQGLVSLAQWVLTKIWRHSDYNNHFVGEHLSVLYVGVLLDGENIEPQQTAKLLAIGKDYLLKHALPAADEIAGPLNRQEWYRPLPYMQYLAQPSDPKRIGAFFVGGQAEGFSYNDWGYARPLALTCEMWRTATGQDLFAGSSFFRGQSVWHAYALRPRGTFARSEDCTSSHKPGSNLKTLMHLLATRLDDPLAEWLARKHQWKYVQKSWQEILWRDPKVKPKSPGEVSLPLAGCFEKLGHVYFRSSWSGKTAAFAMFQCGPFYAGHQHLDNNTFVIHRGGSLAIDAGTNDYTSHRGNYYARTIAHNGIVVFDPDEKFSGRTWSAGDDTSGSNDGGQMRGRSLSRVGQYKPGGPSDIGRILDFRTGRYVAGCVGDATKSYSPKKVRRAVRAFYHLRSDPKAARSIDTFIIYDHVVTTKSALKPKWIMHSIDKPVVTGRRFVVTSGGGKLVGDIAWPLDAKIELVGGPGSESSVAGKNYPPKKKPDPEHGSWRIEIPTAARTLVVLRAMQKDTPAPPPAKITGLGGEQGMILKHAGVQSMIIMPRKTATSLPRILVTGKGRKIEELKLDARGNRI
ncbi:MAG: heparinase II/III family protein [Phycisphaerae bacterium]|jgi:hypothetical protein|nr:heparinase II/III family protein [Phycisphaerae bacterium]